MKKLKNWWLTAGLIILISCNDRSGIYYEKTGFLSDFPSGSSLEHDNGRLYLSGDDASQMLVLDENWNRLDSCLLVPGASKRITKASKPDIEASTIIHINGKKHLALIGSASQQNRELVLLVPLPQLDSVVWVQVGDFYRSLNHISTGELNIEGACSVGNQLVMGNRGNTKNGVNSLLITDLRFFEHPDGAAARQIELQMPATPQFAGLSGLVYVPETDLLLFTASTEETSNSIDDGRIGSGYLGWISRFSTKMAQDKIESDGWENLAVIDPIFKKEKVESLCVSKAENNTYTIHMVSDNDNGTSRLFRIRLQVP